MGATADEQAALRRVADLVTSGSAPEPVQAAAANEISMLLDGSRPVPTPHLVGIFRHEADGAVSVGVVAGDKPAWPVGTRLRLGGRNLPVMEAGVGVPIVVGGRPWGVLCVITSPAEGLVPGTESRLAHFADLVASAIAIAEARAHADRLAEEQAALRRVATFAAGPHPSADILAAIASEAGVLLGVDCTVVYRYRGARHAELMATWGEPDLTAMLGLRTPFDVESVGSRMWYSRKPVRLDDAPHLEGSVIEMAREVGVHSSVGCPVIVDGSLWGGLVVHSTKAETLPADTEARLSAFTELIVTTVVRVEARAQVDRFAGEQGALRRVATLVAQQAPAAELFATVARELATLLGVDCAALLRYEVDETVTVLAGWGAPDVEALVGRRMTAGELSAVMRELGVISSVAGPVVVEAQVWGRLMINSLTTNPLPGESEARIEGFAELVAAAIANAENKAKLTASRARVVATADETQRRLERDLHDGAQQRLVHTLIVLKLAQTAASEGRPTTQLIDEALSHAQRANGELRDLVRGIMPASLRRGGLRLGLESLVEGLALPVDVDVDVPRLPERWETNAYFIVAEAITNAVKHARATQATVKVTLDGDALTVTVEDDGRGGADRAGGTGLAGLSDRVEALEGELQIVSDPGRGTRLQATFSVRT